MAAEEGHAAPQRREASAALRRECGPLGILALCPVCVPRWPGMDSHRRLSEQCQIVGLAAQCWPTPHCFVLPDSHGGTTSGLLQRDWVVEQAALPPRQPQAYSLGHDHLYASTVPSRPDSRPPLACPKAPGRDTLEHTPLTGESIPRRNLAVFIHLRRQSNPSGLTGDSGDAQGRAGPTAEPIEPSLPIPSRRERRSRQERLRESLTSAVFRCLSPCRRSR
jgi:hypothetical protein